MKKVIAGFAALGFIGCFLPLIPGFFSWFDLREFDALAVYLVILAYLAPLLAGLTDKRSIAAGVGLVGFGYVLYFFNLELKDFLFEGGIGARMMAIGVLGGFASSLAGLTRKR